MRTRERRSWTTEEDNMLRAAIKLEEPHADRPSKWHSIARHVPGRTNKDCRKRWCATMASVVCKGGWSSEEDRRLLTAVEKHGTKWSLVAAMVESRNSGQCAKRWNDTLNPAIDRSAWIPEEDAKLLEAVGVHGTSWTTIVKACFPGRTALAAKNRYSHLSRTGSFRRGSSPSSSSVSSVEISEPSTPDVLDLPIDPVLLAVSTPESKVTSKTHIIDSMDCDINIDSPPKSSASSSGSESDIPQFDGELLERFLSDLAASSNANSMQQLLGSTDPVSAPFPACGNFMDPTSAFPPLPDNLSEMDFTNGANALNDWVNLKDFELSALDPALLNQQTPTPETINPPATTLGGRYQPDEQVAVAVAICRADNLRPTVQVLIQSLAGALGQPANLNQPTSPLNKT